MFDCHTVSELRFYVVILILLDGGKGGVECSAFRRHCTLSSSFLAIITCIINIVIFYYQALHNEMSKRPEENKVQLGDMTNFVILQVNTFTLHSIFMFIKSDNK